MALIGTDQEDEQNKIAQPTSSSSTNAHAGSGSGFVGGTGSGSGQGVTANAANTPQAGGGGYANLSQYLQANQGSGATTGQAAENVVQQSGDAAKQAQNDYSANATNDIAKASAGLNTDQATLDKIKNNTIGVNQNTLNQISQKTYSYNPNQKIMNNLGGATDSTLVNIADAGKAINGQNAYAGPTDFSNVSYGGPNYDAIKVNYGGPQSVNEFSGQTAQNQADAIARGQIVQGNVHNAQGGQTGVSALLKNAYQQPNYTAGENSLDSFLANGTTGGQQALAQAGGVGQDVNNNYSNINNLLTGKIQGAQDTAKATNAAYQTAVDKANDTTNATKLTYDNAVAAAQNKGAAAQTALQQDAIKAQAEIDKRAKEKADDETKKKEEELKKQQKGGSLIRSHDINGNVLRSAGGELANMGKRAVNSVGSELGNVTNALNGNQQSSNKLATDVATFGINNVAPNAVKGVTNTAQNIGQRAANSIKKTFKLAHGGKVPSYSKILKALGGCK